MEIIEKEGYSPNRFAKSLRTKESNTIGIMVEDITAFQTPRIINGINNDVEKRGYAVILNNMSCLLYTSHGLAEVTQGIFHPGRHFRVDGPGDQPVLFHGAEGVGQNLLADALQTFLQFIESPGAHH